MKISQKIDSFMASLGVNVGRTGGSMLADAMIAFRAVTMATGGAGRILGGGRHGSGAAASDGNTSSAGPAGFFKGGLIGMAGRHITNSAGKTATTQTSAVHSAQKQSAAAVHTASEKESALEARSDSTTRSDSAIQQEGMILIGSDTPSAAPGSSFPPAGSTVPVGPAASTPADNIPAPDVGIQPIPPAPQEDVIFSSSEIQSASVIQTEGQSDSVLQQEGVIQTGGEHIVHNSSNTVQSETVRQGSEGGSTSEHHTNSQTRSAETVHWSTYSIFPVRMPTLGGTVFSHSLQSGGQFANDVIGMVARGDMRSTGSITGDLAAQSLQSYMGHTALGASAAEKVSFSQVEIGGGRITGREATPEHPQGIEFAMYHVDQYSRPEGIIRRCFPRMGRRGISSTPLIRWSRPPSRPRTVRSTTRRRSSSGSPTHRSGKTVCKERIVWNTNSGTAT